MLAIVGPTATGKSALGIALAGRHGGEIVSCDSTAVHAGIDIGTDKVPLEARRGVPHHLIDVVPVTGSYSAADYARDAAAAVRSILGRGGVPILVGGTGFYYRALTRGLFPGPGRNEPLRSRLRAIASRRGLGFLHRMVGRIDPPSAARIQPRDEVRLVRALEVYFSTGRSLTEHFADTSSPLGDTIVAGVVLEIPRVQIKERVRRRVEEQFRRGVIDEVRRLLASGVPESAQALQGLVYRQIVEHLRGVRDLGATRDLIVSENVRYARRQLIWFRKEPNLDWIQGAGESAGALHAVEAALARRLASAPASSHCTRQG
ncbi:MAG: tRNA (adenosine(37)-N6)-dimethylallyltransferase MiaA [Vicinamibacterales bacterium]